jgi:DNA-binding transcriptional LysR family regulator
MPRRADKRQASALPAPLAGVEDLRALVAVARGGSVSRAARMLGRTQPSISSRLAALEQVWGTRLFRRVARGMSPTPEGARLLPLAEALLRDLEELDVTAGRPIVSARELRVGAGDALGRERLPRALARLLHSDPEVEVHLREGPRPALVEALRAGEIDLALVVASAAEASVEGIDFRPWITSPVDLLTPEDRGRSGAARAARVRSLASERLITLQPGSGFRRHLETACAAARVPFRPAIEVGNLSLVRRFVAAGLGVAPVPAIAFEAGGGTAGVRRQRLAGVPPVTYYRAVRAGVPLSAMTERLLVLLRA